jgi:hypothetical protein
MTRKRTRDRLFDPDGSPVPGRLHRGDLARATGTGVQYRLDHGYLDAGRDAALIAGARLAARLVDGAVRDAEESRFTIDRLLRTWAEAVAALPGPTGEGSDALDDLLRELAGTDPAPGDA